MKIETLRRLDHHVGKWLCRGLQPFRSPMAGRAARLVRRIVVVKLSELGSTVPALPALHRLRERAPDAELFFLVFKENEAILYAVDEATPDHVLVVDPATLGQLLRTGWKAFRALRRLRPDMIIDLELFSRISSAICRLSGAPRRVGLYPFLPDAPEIGRLYTHPVLYTSQRHIGYVYMSLVEAGFRDPPDWPGYKGLIGDDSLILPEHVPAQADAEAARALLAGVLGRHWGRKKILLVNPNASDVVPLRRWPEAHYGKLCRRLLAKNDVLRIVMTGAADEQDEVERLVKEVDCEACVSVAGRTSFTELLALYGLASGLLSNDSGPAHFAALVRLPTVVLFGPETPALYAPLNPNAVCLSAGLACSPCVSPYQAKATPCHDNRCMKLLSVETVHDAVDSMLASGRGAS